MTLDEFISNSLATTFQNKFRKKANFEINYCDEFSNDPNNLKTKFFLGESNLSVITKGAPLKLSARYSTVEENGLSTKAFSIDNYRLNSHGVSFTDADSGSHTIYLNSTFKLSCFSSIDHIINILTDFAKNEYLRENNNNPNPEDYYSYHVNIPFSTMEFPFIDTNSILTHTINSVNQNVSMIDSSTTSKLNSMISSIDEKDRTISYKFKYDVDEESCKLIVCLDGCHFSEDGKDFIPEYIDLYIPITIYSGNEQNILSGMFKSFSIDERKFDVDYNYMSDNIYSPLWIHFEKYNNTIQIQIKYGEYPNSPYESYTGYSYSESNAQSDLSHHENIEISSNGFYRIPLAYEYHTENIQFDSNKDSQIIVKGDVIHKEKEFTPFINAVNKSIDLLDYFEVTEDTITPLINKVLYN